MLSMQVATLRILRDFGLLCYTPSSQSSWMLFSRYECALPTKRITSPKFAARSALPWSRASSRLP